MGPHSRWSWRRFDTPERIEPSRSIQRMTMGLAQMPRPARRSEELPSSASFTEYQLPGSGFQVLGATFWFYVLVPSSNILRPQNPEPRTQNPEPEAQRSNI